MVGIFAGPIEQALTIPMMMMADHNVTQPAKTPVSTTHATTPPPSPRTQAPGNIVDQDTFQRANQVLWGTSSGNETWQGDANNQQEQHIFSIVNANGQIANGQGNFNALLGQANSNEAVMASGKVSHFSNGANLGVVLRWNDTNNWYKALIDGKLLRIIRNFQGRTVNLSVLPFAAQDSTNYTLRFQAQGPTLSTKVWRTGTPEPDHWMSTVSDNTFASGQPGIRVVLRQGVTITIRSFQTTTIPMNTSITS
jgi:hypothetical protein